VALQKLFEGSGLQNFEGLEGWNPKPREFKMRNRFMSSIAALAAGLALSSVMLAQVPAQPSDSAPTKAAIPAAPHDLSGVWNLYERARGQGIYATPSKEVPPMTPWAQAMYDAARPGFGPKAVFADGNDPILQCNPPGVPRVLFFPAQDPHEFVQTPDRVFMFFENNHLWRQIWTDGRGHRKDLEPTWLGDSIGWWEGDTFVVDTVGFNNKSWLDAYGHPHSEDLHLVERYRRVDHETLTMQLIIDDPKAYSTTWVSDTKIFKLLSKNEAVLEEVFCIRDEEDAFTKKIREPAAGQPSK
jgi:hypothetical protein